MTLLRDRLRLFIQSDSTFVVFLCSDFIADRLCVYLQATFGDIEKNFVSIVKVTSSKGCYAIDFY